MFAGVRSAAIAHCSSKCLSFLLVVKVFSPNPEMDLWDVTSNFLISNITGKSFRITDILALSNEVEVQLKPPRNANSGQVSFLLRDLLDMVRGKLPVLEFATKMMKVKQFEALGKCRSI